MIDKVSRDPISPKMLKINGNDVMKLIDIKPGPRIGMIIGALMDEVLDNPGKNTQEYLENRVVELGELSDDELTELGKRGKLKIAEEEEKEVEKIKEKYLVE
jgi:hypothetical protein